MRERLYRSRSDRMLLGVAGGMARYLDVDPAIVRIVWVLLVIAGGAGILLYIVGAIVIPEEPEGWAARVAAGGPTGPDTPGTSTGSTSPGATAGAMAATGAAPGSGPGSGASGPAWGYRAGVERRGRGGGAVLIGVALRLIGGWLLLQRVIPAIDPDVVWPVVLLVLGGALVLGALRR